MMMDTYRIVAMRDMNYSNATTLVAKDSISKVRHGKRFARIGASYISARFARIADIP
tara:strand:+ start:293 stop:463 length:171 start_codon:yes stop_codon:yes gene_type:complete